MYPNSDFWSENKPSGNTAQACDTKKTSRYFKGLENIFFPDFFETETDPIRASAGVG
jgi:hypothetical protein